MTKKEKISYVESMVAHFHQEHDILPFYRSEYLKGLRADVYSIVVTEVML